MSTGTHSLLNTRHKNVKTQRGIIVVGSANMDMVVTVRRYPYPGETIFGRMFGMYPGGKGANQAVAASRLGGDVAFIGKMGNDIFCEQLCRSMRGNGVCLDHLLCDPGTPTGTALIMVDTDGQNEIVVVSGSNMRITPEEIEKKRDVFASGCVTLLQLEIPLATVARAAKLAKENGHLVILNPAPAQTLPKTLLKYVDILTPNETEAGTLTGVRVQDRATAERAAAKLRTLGVRTIVMTMGKRGCLLLEPDGTKHFSSMRVRAVDTTAAGDAFNGALAFSLADGMEIGEAIRFATAVSAYSVTKMGAQSSLPTRQELEHFVLSRRT